MGRGITGSVMSDQQRDEMAFPQGITEFLQVENLSRGKAEIKGGLTKRELLAAMAHPDIINTLACCMDGPKMFKQFKQEREDAKYSPPKPEDTASRYAKAAILYADALLKELAK